MLTYKSVESPHVAVILHAGYAMLLLRQLSTAPDTLECQSDTHLIRRREADPVSSSAVVLNSRPFSSRRCRTDKQ